MAVCVYPIIMRARRSRNSSSVADAAAPSSSAIDGAASTAGGARRASSRLAATSPAKAAAARSPESGGEHAKDNTTNTTVAEDWPSPQQTQPGSRSAGARKRTRTNFYGSEVPAGNADTGTADAVTAGAPRSSSSEARSDTADAAASGDDAAKTNDASSGARREKGCGSAGKTHVAANDNSGAGNRISRLSLTRRRAARAQAQAQSHAQVQTKEKSQAPTQQPSPGRAKGQKYRVGTVISKEFDGVGESKKCYVKLWRVKLTDFIDLCSGVINPHHSSYSQQNTTHSSISVPGRDCVL